MADELFLTADEKDLVRSVNNAIAVLKELGETEKLLVQESRRVTKAGVEITRTVKEQVDAFTTLTQSYKTINGVITAVSGSQKELKDSVAQAAAQARRAGKELDAAFAATRKRQEQGLRAFIATQQKKAQILKSLVNDEKRNAAVQQRLQDDQLRSFLRTQQEKQRILKTMHADEVRAQQAAQTNAKTTTKTVKSQNERIKELTLSWQTMIRIVAAQLIRRAVTAVLGAIREASAAAAEFSIRIAEIRTISQSADSSVQEWSLGLRRLSDDFNIDLIDQAEAAYQALSNQVVEGVEAFKFLESANKLAKVGVTSAEASVNLLTAALNAFHIDASESDRVAAILFKTVEQGRIRIDELAQSYGKVAVPANQLGITFEELNASLATITIQGIKANQAQTLMRAIMIKLIKPTKEMKKLFRELGVENAQAAIKAFTWPGLLQKIEERTKGSASELGNLFSRTRAITGAMIFAGEGLKTFQNNMDEFQTANKNFGKAFELIFESAGETVNRELNQIKNVFISDFGAPIINALAAIQKAGIDMSDVVASVTKVILISVAAVGAAVLIWNPWVLAIGLAALNLIAIDTLLKDLVNGIGSVNREMQQFFKARIDDAEKAQAARIKLQEDTIDTLLQNETRLNAEVIGNLNEISDKAADELEELTKIIGKMQKQIIKDFQSDLKALDKSIRDIDKNIAKAERQLEQAGDRGEDILFEWKVEDLDVEDQLQELEKRRDEFKIEAQVDLDQGNLEAAAKKFKEAEDIIVRMHKLTRKANEDNEKFLEKIRKAAAKGDKEQIRQITDAGRLQRFVQRDTAAELKELIDEQLQLTIQAIELEEKRRADLKKQKIQDELDLFNFKQTLQKLESDDLEKAIKARDEEAILDALNSRSQAIEELISLQENLGIKTEQVAKLERKFALEQVQANNTVRQLRLDSAAERAAELDKIIKTQAAAIPDEVALTERVNARLDETFTRLQQIGSGIPPSLKDDFGELIVIFNALKLAQDPEAFRAFSAEAEDFFELIKDAPQPAAIQQRRERQLIAQRANGLLVEEGGQIDLLAEAFTARVDGLKEAETVQEQLNELAKLSNEISAVGLRTAEEQVKTEETLKGSLEERKDLLIEIRNLQLDIAKAAGVEAADLNLIEPINRADGGMAPHGSDTVPAMLTPGEFVMNAGATRKFYSQLLSMNQIKGYADGGEVTNISGDFNITVNGSGNPDADARAIGKKLRRGIRQRTIKLQ